MSEKEQQPESAATHRCNGVNGAEHHGTQNKCTVCGEYREGWYDAKNLEVRAPSPIEEQK